MLHLRDMTTGHEQRIETKRSVTYVYVAMSRCGLTRPAATLHKHEPGELLLGDVCPDCLATIE